MKAYIGATTLNLSKRMQNHKHSAFTLRSTAELYSAIRECGWHNFAISEIEICGVLSLFERETYWIKELNTMWPNGYNTESSHEKSNDNRRTFQSDVVKEKKRQAALLRYSDPLELKRQTRRIKKMFKDPETKEAHRQGLINSWTDERRAEYAEKFKQNVNLREAKGWIQSGKACSKKIECFDIQEKKTITYKSASECARSIGISVSSITQSIKRKSAMKERYVVKYKDDERTMEQVIQEIEEQKAYSYMHNSSVQLGKIPPNVRSVKLINIETNEELIFKTVNDAAKYLKRQTTNISHACNNVGSIVAGHYAEYLKE